jgi:Holliday junction resolvase
MKPGGGRKKGHDGEREIVNYFKAKGWDAKRNYQQGKFDKQPDISVTAYLMDEEGEDNRWKDLAIEVKRPSKLPKFLTNAMKQVTDVSESNDVCMVVMREDRGKWYCFLGLDDLMELIS